MRSPRSLRALGFRERGRARVVAKNVWSWSGCLRALSRSATGFEEHNPVLFFPMPIPCPPPSLLHHPPCTSPVHLRWEKGEIFLHEQRLLPILLSHLFEEVLPCVVLRIERLEEKQQAALICHAAYLWACECVKKGKKDSHREDCLMPSEIFKWKINYKLIIPN